jgi:anti-sigma regulatory factor (Ser/Thr protein kinase)
VTSVMAGRPEGYSLLLSCGFRGGQLATLRRRVLRAVRRCGLGSDAADGFLIAVNEAMTNAVRHGGGVGRLGLWVDGDIRCEVADHGTGFPAQDHLSRTEPAVASASGGMGLWIARQTADHLAIESGPGGTTVTITAERRA